MVLSQREGRGLQHRQRQRRLWTPRCSEQDAESSIGMTHEVSTGAHEIADVFGVTQEVFAMRCRARPIFSWSACVLGSTATEITGYGKSIFAS